MAIVEGNVYLSNPSAGVSTIEIPTEVGGIPEGRLLLAGITLPGNRSILPETGWEILYQNTTQAAASGVTLAVLARITGDAEPDSYTFESNIVATEMTGMIQEIVSGFDPDFPFGRTAAVTFTSAGTSAATGNRDFYEPNSYALGFAASDTPANTITASMPFEADVETRAQAADAVRRLAAAGGTKVNATAGGINYGWSASVTHRAAFMVVINPPLTQPYFTNWYRAIASGTSLNINHGGIFNGRALIAVGHVDGAAKTVLAPAGWDLVGHVNTLSPSLSIYRRLSSSEPSTWQFTQAASDWMQVTVMEVIGFMTDWLDDMQSSEVAADGTDHAIAEATAEADGALALLYAAIDSGSTTSAFFTPPAGWTEIAELNVSSLHGVINSKSIPTAGSTGAGTIATTQSGDWKSVVFVVASQPAPGGGNGGEPAGAGEVARKLLLLR